MSEHVTNAMDPALTVDVDLAKDVISRALPQTVIKKRQMSYGKELSYIEGHTVIGLLNEAFNYRWSFEIISCEIIQTVQTKAGAKQGHVVRVLGRLTVPGLGVREQFGTKQLIGGVDVQESAFKAATTDALKKCATLFNIGKELYVDDVSELSEESARDIDTVSAIRNSTKTKSAPKVAQLNKDNADKIRELKALLGITNNADLNEYVSEATNKAVTSYAGITDQNAQAIIKLMERDVNEQS